MSAVAVVTLQIIYSPKFKEKKGGFMNSTEEKIVNTIEFDAKAKELIERIRQMNKEKFDEESKEYDELAEQWVREEIEEKYGPEWEKLDLSSADIFSILDVYVVDSDISKVSVNGLIDKILMYTGIDYASNLAGKEDYGYRDISAYKDLIATLLYRAADESRESKTIIDKDIKQDGSGITIANNTITGLIIYLIFIAKSDRFCRYHKWYKSKKDYPLKEYERIIFERFYEKVAGYINLKNMCYKSALNCFDIWGKLGSFLEYCERKNKSGKQSFSNAEELGEVIGRLVDVQKQCKTELIGLLNFNTSVSEYNHMTSMELKDLKIKLLCKSLTASAIETIGMYDEQAEDEEKELLIQELSKVSINPGLRDYIHKTTETQREFLFDKLYEFRSMIDELIPSKK